MFTLTGGNFLTLQSPFSQMHEYSGSHLSRETLEHGSPPSEGTGQE